MSYYVVVTSKCAESAKKHNISDKVNDLKDEIEKKQYIGFLDYFPSFFLKKRFERQQRLVAQEKRVTLTTGEEVSAIIFYDIFIRGNAQYREFIDSPKEYAEKNFEKLISEQDIQAEINRRIRNQKVVKFPELTDGEYSFLYSTNIYRSNSNNESMVYESSDWVQSVKEKKVHSFLSKIADTLIDVIDKKTDNTLVKVKNEEITVVFKNFHDKIFVAGMSTTAEKTEELQNKYEDILLQTDINENSIAKKSVRSYPSFVLADKNIWLEIEEDHEANLALSPEEINVLQEINSGSSGYHFPFFINGRAGSGKSTILYYIYSSLFYSFENNSKENNVGLPLLLSYSQDLVQRARNTICSILNTSAYNISEQKQGSRLELLKRLESTVLTFQEFLASIIKQVDEQHPILSRKHIDHALFRKLWKNKFGRLRLPDSIDPDICWHIIRTYIKGTSPDNFLTPDDYSELPAKQKSVSEGVYTAVFQNIWESWYKLLTASQSAEYYDDQDIVREILSSNYDISKYSSVCCDEAQDFTRQEISLIYRLSQFTKRSLTLDSVGKIPIIFAGDPFQTLNPTGFRWDAVKADFHQNLEATFRVSFKKNAVSYCELLNNYRSSSEIVRFCNSLQWFRAKKFDIADLKPQQVWVEQRATKPVFLELESTFLWLDPLKESQNTIIIVPCLMGEEAEYVKNDPYLSSFVEIAEDVPQNVFSAVRVKGLEFSRVVLYRFGDDAPSCLTEADNTAILPDNDLRITVEYFLNKLYVALSRPRNSLIIVDERKYKSLFWEKLPNNNNCGDFVTQDSDEIWLDEIGGFTENNLDAWRTETDEDELELAKSLEEQGILKKDPYFLRNAARNFDKAQERSKMFRSLGYADYFESKWESAASNFELAGNMDDALKALWMGRCFKEIIEFGERVVSTQDEIIFKLAATHQSGDIDRFIDVIKDVRQLINADKIGRLSEIIENTEAWNSVILSTLTKTEKSSNYPLFRAQISPLEDEGFAISLKNKILLEYRCGNIDQAKKLYDTAEFDKTEDKLFRNLQRSFLLYQYEKEQTDKFSHADWAIILENSSELTVEKVWGILKKVGNLSLLENYADRFNAETTELIRFEAALWWLNLHVNGQEIKRFSSLLLSNNDSSNFFLKYILRLPKIIKKSLVTWFFASSPIIREERLDSIDFIRKSFGEIPLDIFNVIAPDDVFLFMRNVRYLNDDIAKQFEVAIQKFSKNADLVYSLQRLWLLNNQIRIKNQMDRGRRENVNKYIQLGKKYLKEWKMKSPIPLTEDDLVSTPFSSFSELMIKQMVSLTPVADSFAEATSTHLEIQSSENAIKNAVKDNSVQDISEGKANKLLEETSAVETEMDNLPTTSSSQPEVCSKSFEETNNVSLIDSLKKEIADLKRKNAELNELVSNIREEKESYMKKYIGLLETKINP